MALQAFGPTSIHRRTWVFMDHLPWTMRVYREAQAQLFDLPAREVAEPMFSAEIPQVDPWGARGPARR